MSVMPKRVLLEHTFWLRTGQKTALFEQSNLGSELESKESHFQYLCSFRDSPPSLDLSHPAQKCASRADSLPNGQARAQILGTEETSAVSNLPTSCNVGTERCSALNWAPLTILLPKHWKEAEKFISSYNAIGISAVTTEGYDLGSGVCHGPLALKFRFCQGAKTTKRHCSNLIQPQLGYHIKKNFLLSELRK